MNRAKINTINISEKSVSITQALKLDRVKFLSVYILFRIIIRSLDEYMGTINRTNEIWNTFLSLKLLCNFLRHFPLDQKINWALLTMV